MPRFKVPFLAKLRGTVIVDATDVKIASDLVRDPRNLAEALPNVDDLHVLVSLPGSAEKKLGFDMPHISQRWAVEVERAICKKCKSQCCTIDKMKVILDYEAHEGGLRRFKHNTVTEFGVEKHYLKKRKDGSCVYFNLKKNQCSIYHRRPKACRAFFCGRGTKNKLTWERILLAEKEEKKERDARRLRSSKGELVKKHLAPTADRDVQEGDHSIRKTRKRGAQTKSDVAVPRLQEIRDLGYGVRPRRS